MYIGTTSYFFWLEYEVCFLIKIHRKKTQILNPNTCVKNIRKPRGKEMTVAAAFGLSKIKLKHVKKIKLISCNYALDCIAQMTPNVTSVDIVAHDSYCLNQLVNIWRNLESLEISYKFFPKKFMYLNQLSFKKLKFFKIALSCPYENYFGLVDNLLTKLSKSNVETLHLNFSFTKGCPLESENRQRAKFFLNLVETIPDNLRKVKLEFDLVNIVTVNKKLLQKLARIISVKFTSEKLQELSIYPVLLPGNGLGLGVLLSLCDSVYYCKHKLTIFR